MSDAAIRVEGLGKRYRIGTRRGPYQTLREAMVRAATAPVRWLSKNGRRAEENHIWALEDISFEVKQAEVLGVIGRNGASKSMLLKILTEGRAEIRGRAPAPIEVGRGIHPGPTARENVYHSSAGRPIMKIALDDAVRALGGVP